MKIVLWFRTVLLLAVNFSIAVTAEQDLSLMLVQTLQNQLQTCMNQNAELVKRTCNGGNNYTESSNTAKIAFYAGLNESVQNLPYNYKLVFNKVYLNEGKAYDSDTGVFTCPMDGIYVFHWIILTKAGHYFYTDFMVNDNLVGRSHPNAVTANRAASSTVVQRLKKGDKAWIEPHANYSGQFAYEGWSFYSGYMI